MNLGILTPAETCTTDNIRGSQRDVVYLGLEPKYVCGIESISRFKKILFRVNMHSANKKIPNEEDSDADPSDPYVFGPPGCRSGSEVWIRILLSAYKNSKKNLDSYCFVILFDFLSLKNDVNVPSKSKKNFFVKIKFFVGILKVNDENSRIRIH